MRQVTFALSPSTWGWASQNLETWQNKCNTLIVKHSECIRVPENVCGELCKKSLVGRSKSLPPAPLAVSIYIYIIYIIHYIHKLLVVDLKLYWNWTSSHLLKDFAKSVRYIFLKFIKFRDSYFEGKNLFFFPVTLIF